MAISRREILKLGVSYGTGAINFGNDSVVYERELRKLVGDETLENFLESIKDAQELIDSQIAALEQEAAAALEQGAATAQEPAAEQEQEQRAPEEQEPKQDATNAQEQKQELSSALDTEQEASLDAEEQEPEANPLKDAVAAGKTFQELCARLALSDLYTQMSVIIAALNDACLPAVEDLSKLKESYQAIIDYLKRC
jgi:flagellar biosynthesis GTPase FlhF